MEKAIFMGNAPQLFGMLFLPDEKCRKSKGFVVIHPFAEEKKSAHRTLVDLSRRLYRSGFPVLMFDLRGCGDSEGSFADVRQADWMADIDTAVNELRLHTDLPDLGIIGLRFGAYLACCYTAKNPSVSEHIWIEPVLQPVDYLRKSLRHKLMKELCTDGAVTSSRDGLLQNLQNDASIDFDGYEIGAGLYRDLVLSQKEQVVESGLENIRNGLSVSVSMNGKPTKALRDIRNLKPEMRPVDVKMELFWNKVDDADSEELILPVDDYVNEGNAYE